MPRRHHHAVSWNSQSITIFDGFPGGTSYSQANDINNQGIVVGEYEDLQARKPFIRVGTSIGTLPVLSQPNITVATAINESFQIVGYATTLTNNYALLWQNGQLVDISKDFDIPDTAALDINDNGQVTGWMSSGGANNFQAFIWRSGNMTEIPNFRGGLATQGRAINNRGEVVGNAVVPTDDQNGYAFRAFHYSDGDTIDLGILSGFGFDESLALDVNDEGKVVGFCAISGNLSRGFIWHDGTLYDLNDFIDQNSGFEITIARAITNSGVILGEANIGPGSDAIIRMIPRFAPLGDLTCNGVVNGIDLGILLSQWGTDGPADLDRNGVVNGIDLGILLGAWTL